jgi:hypothetical protein
VVYTSPLLHRMRGWNNSSLGMYIDDGVISAFAETWEGITTLLCQDWLSRAGLPIEPEKSEVLFLWKLVETAREEYHNPAYDTKIFVNHKLYWIQHVNNKCNRAWASLKSLQPCNCSETRFGTSPPTTGCCQLYTGQQKTLVKRIQTKGL